MKKAHLKKSVLLHHEGSRHFFIFLEGKDFQSTLQLEGETLQTLRDCEKRKGDAKKIILRIFDKLHAEALRLLAEEKAKNLKHPKP